MTHVETAEDRWPLDVLLESIFSRWLGGGVGGPILRDLDYRRERAADMLVAWRADEVEVVVSHPHRRMRRRGEPRAEPQPLIVNTFVVRSPRMQEVHDRLRGAP